MQVSRVIGNAQTSEGSKSTSECRDTTQSWMQATPFLEKTRDFLVKLTILRAQLQSVLWPTSSTYIRTQVTSSSSGALLKKMGLLTCIQQWTFLKTASINVLEKGEGDEHMTNFHESEHLLRFMDTVTSFQEHSLLHATAVSQIFSSFCLQVPFLGSSFSTASE